MKPSTFLDHVWCSILVLIYWALGLLLEPEDRLNWREAREVLGQLWGRE